MIDVTNILNAVGSVVIDDLNIESNTGKTYLFTNPQDIIIVKSPDDLDYALNSIDNLQSECKYLAGYISYDAGLCLDKPIKSRHMPNIPLIWLGVYNSVQIFDYNQTDLISTDTANNISNLHSNIDKEEYKKCLLRIKEYINTGDVYQVNYTYKMLFENSGKASGLFARLRKSHKVCHSAFINAGNFQVISLSPELFLRKTANKLFTRPMKGTIKRGCNVKEDTDFANALQLDEKNRAENIMIVDLMRNDIGRICKFGSVAAPGLFHVEKYGSVFQMTSDVEGILSDNIRTSDIIKATFPPGSITGAPKIRAMEIIDELESDSRGVYCGCVGMFSPGGDILLNVAIRTIIQDGNSCELGIGGGIVADSNPEEEFKESVLKSSFIKSQFINFQLLETLLYIKGSGYIFADEHIIRLERSAIYFGWKSDIEKIRIYLTEKAGEIESSELPVNSKIRIRLLISENGSIEVHWSLINAHSDKPVSLLIASRQTDPNDIFLYHKTTNRQEYDKEHEIAGKNGHFDVLYLNNRGELTECAIANIILEIDGKWLTPPLSCGLLLGIWREKIIAEKSITEQILTYDDIKKASRIIIGNSVRGGIEVRSIKDDHNVVYKR